MNIEILEFYPIAIGSDRQTLSGTLRIRLPDIGLHILGVFVSKKKDSWFFRLPGQKAIHHETDEKIFYPHVSFEDKNQQQELITAIRDQAPAFIEQKLKDNPSLLICPPVQKKCRDDAMHGMARNSAEKAKLNELTTKAERPNQKEKIWIDPPLRKFIRSI